MKLPINTWQKHFYSVFLKNIIATLITFYGIYVILDVMTHLKEIASGKTALWTWIIYYISAFSKRFDILVPFAILVATIRSLHQFQQRGELIAMLASGTSKVRLMMPCLTVCCGFFMLTLINYDLILPKAVASLRYIRVSDFDESSVDEEDPAVRQVLLQDSSRIIYSSYDQNTQEFGTVFWIRKPTEIYYMKRLSIKEAVPVGYFIDKLVRNHKHEFEKTHSFERQSFPKMDFDKTSLADSVTPPQDQSLTQLTNELIVYSRTHSSRLTEIKANLFYKLTFPLLCLVAFLAPAPQLLRFGRIVPILMIYLVSIAGLFCLNLILQALFVVSKNNLVSPFIAIILPWCALMCWLTKRFIKGT